MFEEPDEDDEAIAIEEQARAYHEFERKQRERDRDLRYATRRAASQDRDARKPRSNAFVRFEEEEDKDESDGHTIIAQGSEDRPHYDEDKAEEEAYYSDPGATPPRANGKRAARHTPPARSPVPKKKKLNFDRFQEGRTMETTDAVLTELARRVIVDMSLEKYLPLHYLSDEVVEQEERAIVVTIDDERPKIVVTRGESTCSYEDWVTWSDRLLGALAALRVPLLIFRMFSRHFRTVRRGRRHGSTWTTWRAYDIATRRRLCYDKPPDIGIFDKKLFDILERDGFARMMEQQERLNACTERLLGARPGPSKGSHDGHGGPSRSSHGAAASRSRQTASATGTRYVKSTYDRCLLCGSGSHLFDKEKANKQECSRKPTWLSWDKVHGVYKVPGEDAVICWRFNSKQGCGLDDTRERAPTPTRTPRRSSSLPAAATSDDSPMLLDPRSPHTPRARTPVPFGPRSPHTPAARPSTTIPPRANHAQATADLPPATPQIAAAARPVSVLPMMLDSLDFPPADSIAGGALLDAPLHPVVTPFIADAWHDDLAAAGLLGRYAHVPVGILHGFDVGLPRETIDAYFARTSEPYKLYKNHKTAEQFPDVIEKMIEEETR
ncbi:hypothetical protein AURDEDRAFT_172554 [Auricularia subglabra TFB-10046 SS5]|nr:hypothetical protein AURDEDRAFT_172554 [Auricularia subglabra TFB-10046 SS5]